MTRHFAITRAQREALFKVFQRDFPNFLSPGRRYSVLNKQPLPVSTIQWRRFRKRVQPSFDKSGCIMLQWKGMWLGIEQDGYCHS